MPHLQCNNIKLLGMAVSSSSSSVARLRVPAFACSSMDQFLEFLLSALVSCLHIPGSRYSPSSSLFQLIFLHHRSYDGDEVCDYWLERHIVSILERISTVTEHDLAAEVARIVGSVPEFLSESTGECNDMWVEYYMGVALLSEERLSKSFHFARTAFFKHRIAMVMGTIAARAPNDASKAKKYYGLAKDAAEELNDHDKLFSAMHALGEQMLRSADFREAADLEGQLSQMAAECGGTLCLAHAASLSASIAGFVGNEEANRKHGDKVMALLSDFPMDVEETQKDLFIRDRPGAVSPWRVIRAKRMLDQAGQRSGDSEHDFQNPVEYAEFLVPTSRYEEAEAVAADMLRDATSDDMTAGTLLLVSVIALHWGSLEIADSVLEEAERLGRRSNVSMLLRVLNAGSAILQRMDKHDISIRKLEEAARLQMSLDKNFGEFSMGRISYLEDHKRSFRLLQPLLLKFGAPERKYEAVVWGERERARDLIYTMGHPDEREAYRRNLEEFDDDNARAWEEIKDIVRQAGDEAAVLFVSTYAMHTVILTQLLHWDTEASEIRHWHATIKVDGSSFNELLERTRNGMLISGYGNVWLKFWYGLLIGPHERPLEAVQPKRLIIVPQEEVSLIPFAALFKEEGGPYLIERYAISLAPSLRMYKHCTRLAARASDKPAAAAVISPKFPPGRGLPGAELEASEVARDLMSSGMHVTYLQGSSATKEAVMNVFPASSWVHIASHAIFSDSFPNGAILLSSPAALPSSSSSASTSSHEDQFLKMERAFRTALDSEYLRGEELGEAAKGRTVETQVAVLSACQTGLGQLRSEGVLGLTRAFHLLGVSTVVASLWKVDDCGSQVLMKAFYQHLKNGKDVGLALQDAIVGMIHEEDDFGHPKYEPDKWAPFFICGTDKASLPTPPLIGSLTIGSAPRPRADP